MSMPYPVEKAFYYCPSISQKVFGSFLRKNLFYNVSTIKAAFARIFTFLIGFFFKKKRNVSVKASQNRHFLTTPH